MDESKKFNDIYNDDQDSFASLEKSFQIVVTELVNDKSLDTFRAEYEKLYEALKISHDANNKLINKCKELNNEIIENSQKIQSALRYSEEDQNTITRLRAEFDRAWNTLEQFSAREIKNLALISALKEEIIKLQNEAEILIAKSPPPENNEELAKLIKEIENGAPMPNPQDFFDIRKKISLNKNEIEKIESTISEMKEEIEVSQKASNQCDDFLVRYDKEWKELTEKVKLIAGDNEQKITALEDINEKIEHKKLIVDSLKLQNNPNVDEIIALKDKTEFARIRTEEFKNKSTKNQETAQYLNFTIEKRKQALKEKEETLNEQKKILKNVDNQYQGVKEEYDTIVKVKKQFEAKIAEKKKKIRQIQKDSSSINRKINEGSLTQRSVMNQIQAVERQTLITETNVSKIQNQKESEKILQSDAIKELTDAKSSIAASKSYIKELQNEILQFQAETRDLLNQANVAEIQAMTNNNNLLKMNEKITQINERIKNRKRDIMSLVNDHAVSARQIEGCAHEETEVEKDLKFLTDQSEHLKRVTQAADNSCIDVHVKRLQLETDNDKRSKIVASHQQKLSKKTAEIESIDAKITSLEVYLEEANRDLDRLRTDIELRKHENDAVVNIIGGKVKESNRVKSDIRSLEGTIMASSRLFEAKINEVERLKSELCKLVDRKRELSIVETVNKRYIKERLRLEKQLSLEQTKGRLLMDELAKPRVLNYRELMKSYNPEKYALLDLRQRLFDQIHDAISQSDRLKFTKAAAEVNLSKKMEKFSHSEGSRNIADEMKEITKQLQQKNAAFERLQKKADAEKARADSAFARCSEAQDALRVAKVEYYQSRKVHPPTTMKQLTPRMSHVPRLQLTRLPPVLPSIQTVRARPSVIKPTLSSMPASARL